MNITFTKHARFRIRERSACKLKILRFIFKSNYFIKIGYDLFKKNVVHCLFINRRSGQFYILVVDERSGSVITILYGDEFKNWCIDPFLFKALRDENYELKRDIVLEETIKTPANHYSVYDVLNNLNTENLGVAVRILDKYYDLSKNIRPKGLADLIRQNFTNKKLTEGVVDAVVSTVLTQLNYQ